MSGARAPDRPQAPAASIGGRRFSTPDSDDEFAEAERQAALEHDARPQPVLEYDVRLQAAPEHDAMSQHAPEHDAMSQPALEHDARSQPPAQPGEHVPSAEWAHGPNCTGPEFKPAPVGLQIRAVRCNHSVHRASRQTFITA